MQITVYGATGTFGHPLADALRERGHSVIPAHRGIGVDTATGEGVTEAAEGSDVLVDCVNFTHVSRHRTLDFFSRSSRQIALAAAEHPGASVVCLSIAFKPAAASRMFGYYQAKELQETVYRRLVPTEQLLIVRSAQWFELVESTSLTAGPVTIVPNMRVRALAAAEAARMTAEAIDAGERGTLEIAGPEISDFATIARTISRAEAARSSGGLPGGRGARRPRRVVGIPIPGPVSRDGLIPDSPRLSAVTVEEWLRTR